VDLQASAMELEQVLDRRLVKKGNAAVPQVLAMVHHSGKQQLHGKNSM